MISGHYLLRGHNVSVASRLQNCGNSAEYIYLPHEWKAGAPVHPQKMRPGCIFQRQLQPYPLKATIFFFLQEINKVQEKKYISNSQCVDKSISKNQSVNSVASMSISRSVKRNQSPLLLLGCGTVEILLNRFISHINGRLAHPSVRRK